MVKQARHILVCLAVCGAFHGAIEIAEAQPTTQQATPHTRTHSKYCGHHKRLYERRSRVHKAKFHHQDNFQGEHWHFYIHSVYTNNGWVKIDGYWRLCGGIL